MIWFVAGSVIWVDNHYCAEYLSEAGSFGLRGKPEAVTPLSRVTFSFAADAQTWIRYALQLDETPTPQLRYTHLDNAPLGREVHWNSAWAWTIAAAGRVRRHFTGEPLPLATERSAAYLNGIVLFVLVIAITQWVASRAGGTAAMIAMLGMVGSRRFYEGFLPSYVDHHGLLTASVFGLVLGLLFAGAGWWDETGAEALLPGSTRVARRNACYSALAGAVGVWVSAASVIPPIALIGVSAIVTIVWRGRAAKSAGIRFDPVVWRIWGRTGAALCVVFYLLEYAPFHLGMRMEVNHPLYALAWLGGGELIAQFGAWYVAEGLWWSLLNWRLIGALVAIACPALAIAVGGSHVFLPMDPFLAELHRSIIEFMSLPQLVHFFGWQAALNEVNADMIPLALAVAMLGWWRGRSNLLLTFTVVTALTFVGMGFWQERWLLNASGPAICLALLIPATVRRTYPHPIAWWIALGTMATVFIVPAVDRIGAMRNMVQARTVTPKDALQPLFRDIAAALRASQPNGNIVMLSSPNSSTGIGYYGRFETIGTLYWENKDGLKAAAEIFSAHTDAEAAKLIKSHGITHIAMVSEENFLKQYYTLLHPGAGDSEVQQSFGYRLLGSLRIPVWLEVLPYGIPSDLKLLNQRVMLYKVNFNQTPAEALANFVNVQLAWNELAGAENSVNQLIKIAPEAPQPWVKKGIIFVRRGRWGEALAVFEHAAELTPAADRGTVYKSAGEAFYAGHAAKFAVHMFQQALALSFDAEAAYRLAWIRSTSTDGAVRNGAAALAIAERLVRTDSKSLDFAGCLAAALAETGDTTGATRVAEAALNGVPRDFAGVEALQKQLAMYRAGRPWRE